MTSSIKVTAHCSKDKHVVVTEQSTPDSPTSTATILEDGQSYDCVVYDSKTVKIEEVLKQPQIKEQDKIDFES